MYPSIVARTLVAAAAATAFSAGAFAWWDDRCDCHGEDYGYYGPAPVYVYDHSTGPTWTGNGWSYPPIGAYYPRPYGYEEAYRYRSGHHRHRHRRDRRGW